MNQLFLLKLIADLIKDNNPSNIKTAQTILDNMIKSYEVSDIMPIINNSPIIDHNLDPEALEARKELL